MFEGSIFPGAQAVGCTLEDTWRLQIQPHSLNPFTSKLFEQAGIRQGMKVLDVGSGAGDVVLLLSDLVGPGGSVIGIDISPVMLRTAQARILEASLSNVGLLEGDVETLTLDTDFDAIVGRNVLAFLPAPALVLHKLGQHVRSGGIIAFQELDMDHLYVRSEYPPYLLHEQARYWIVEALRLSELPRQMGMSLYGLFLDAGLPQPYINSEALIGHGSDWIGYEYLTEVVRGLLPLILKFGIATAREVAIETLAERLHVEAMNLRTIVRGPDLVSAWTHKL